MTRVTMKPSEEVVAAATAEVTTTDEKGRVIKLRKPGVLAQFRLVEMMGESAENRVYMNMVLPMLFVIAIDGVEIPPPSTKLQIEALITRLDHDGVDAVVSGVSAAWGKPDPEADREALKKP